MAKYSIRDLENLSGVKAHTIRIWEKRYNLVKPMRTSTNIRYYCDDDLKKLLNITILINNGFRVSKVANLEQKELKDKVIFLINEKSDYDSRIENLISTMIDIDEVNFEKILNSSILSHGFENTIIDTIYPFLDRIGILWQTGAINPAQEHFISNLIRRKLLVAIDSLKHEEIKSQKRFILFLPEGELHEIGLLVYNYMIRKKGHKVIYLGQTVPFDDIVEVDKIRSTDFLFTSFVTSFPDIDVDQYLKKLSSTFKEKKIFVTGKQVQALKRTPRNITVIHSLADFHQKFEKSLEK